jgi:hypothetical protein
MAGQQATVNANCRCSLKVQSRDTACTAPRIQDAPSLASHVSARKNATRRFRPSYFTRSMRP